jgi:hypothetical protein
VLYAEGGSGSGLNIFLKDGAIHGGAWAMSTWPGTFVHSGDIEAGVWHHVAITLDSTEEVRANAFSLYLDGARVGSGPAARLPAHGGTIIGRDENTRYEEGPGKTPDSFVGRISDLRIYDRALSATELGHGAK